MKPVWRIQHIKSFLSMNSTTPFHFISIRPYEGAVANKVLHNQSTYPLKILTLLVETGAKAEADAIRAREPIAIFILDIQVMSYYVKTVSDS
jgi:hypothetical protein